MGTHRRRGRKRGSFPKVYYEKNYGYTIIKAKNEYLPKNHLYIFIRVSFRGKENVEGDAKNVGGKEGEEDVVDDSQL